MDLRCTSFIPENERKKVFITDELGKTRIFSYKINDKGSPVYFRKFGQMSFFTYNQVSTIQVRKTSLNIEEFKSPIILTKEQQSELERLIAIPEFDQETLLLLKGENGLTLTLMKPAEICTNEIYGEISECNLYGAHYHTHYYRHELLHYLRMRFQNGERLISKHTDIKEIKDEYRKRGLLALMLSQEYTIVDKIKSL